jgi:outer membrane murein-binding lipoprotein Lpp
MNACLALILALIASPSVALVEEDAKNPVSKVTNLLKDMIEQLEKEAEEDEDTYTAMGCWCETNDKEKTKSIADAEGHIADLTAAIEEFTASSAKLNTEIENLNKEIAKNQQALDTATALRTKQLAEFNEEEKDMLQSISSLKSAVIALSKHHESMLQDSDSTYETIVSMLHDELHKHKDLLQEVITPKQRKAIDAFAQAEDGIAFLQSSAPASGEIFGILKQMKETFETNLAASQKEEMENQKAYEDLKAAKEEEIAAGESLADTKTTTLAATDEKNAMSKEDLEDTQETLAADTAFLANLKERCANMDQEYEERTKTRQLEIQAVSKALAFLSSDEAHDLFTRTFNFVQVSSSSNRRSNVAKSLDVAAKKFNDPRLSTLAVQARLDAFTKVKKSIQDMVDKLIKEKEDEIKHKDFCIEEINNNERDTEMKERDRDDLIAKIDDLASTIDSLAKAIEVLKAEVAEMQVQMKRAGEDREKANKEFQMTVADQRATQKLLAAALNILKGFYEKAALVQTRAVAKSVNGQAPPPGFKSYEKNAASGGVMGMMSGIINDAKAMEAEAIRGEESAQKTYEEFVMDTNNSIEAKVKDITSKTESKAKAEGDKVEAETERDSVLGELEQLANENADLHKSCDFTLKNFELRQTARDEEIEALKQSIAMFSGASFSAFLENNN